MKSPEQFELSADLPLEPRAEGGPVPLGSLQLALLDELLHQSRRSVRMCASAVRVSGPLNTGALRQSLLAAVHRHESLRTRIVMVEGIPRQQIDTIDGYELPVFDLSDLPGVEAETEAKRLAQEFIDKGIDLSVGPLFEAILMKLSDCEHVLILALDHVVADAKSCEILNRDIWTFYAESAQGLACSLPGLPVQFADYVVWQHRTYDAWRRTHESYWRERLGGAPFVKIPVDGNALNTKLSAGATMHFPFGKRLSADLRELARREQILLPLAVLAIHVSVMSRWCRQDDLVLGFASHGRYRRPELENMIGYLASLLMLRIEIKDHSFLDLLKQIKLEFSAACEHQDHGRLLRLFPGSFPELTFNWLPSHRTLRSSEEQRLAQSPLRIRSFPVRFAWLLKFTPLFYESAAGIGVVVHYRSDMCAPGTVEMFGKNLRLLAKELVEHPRAQVASASIEQKLWT